LTGWLLDTNVLSELRRPRPDERVVAFVADTPLDAQFVSVVTFAEMRFGIALLADAAKRQDLQEWLDTRVRPLFAGRLLDVTEDVMLRWRILVESGRKTGHTYSQPDLIIAATALHHGLTVVTRDTGDYRLSGVALLDPWAA
jgi:predicted nucleic acid-binding protein